MGVHDLIDYILSVVTAAFGWIGKSMWNDLQSQKHDLSTLREQIATERVHKNDLKDLTDAIFKKLDRIEDKLDGKADK